MKSILVKLKLILLLISVMFCTFTSLNGCSSNGIEKVSSLNLIKGDIDAIDQIEVQKADEDGSVSSIVIDDKKSIQKVIGLLNNFNVKKLSEDDEKTMLNYGNRLSENDSYIISLRNTKNTTNKQVVGAIIVLLEENQIIFFDTDSMQGEKRSISYIGSDVKTRELNDIISILDENK